MITRFFVTGAATVVVSCLALPSVAAVSGDDAESQLAKQIHVQVSEQSGQLGSRLQTIKMAVTNSSSKDIVIAGDDIIPESAVTYDGLPLQKKWHGSPMCMQGGEETEFTIPAGKTVVRAMPIDVPCHTKIDEIGRFRVTGLVRFVLPFHGETELPIGFTIPFMMIYDSVM